MTTPTTERTVHLRTCPLCEAMCGLEIHVEGDEVALIRADQDDVWRKGHLCPKGTTLGHLHHDPDRLRAPLVRDGDDLREVSWDEAFRRCTELLAPVIAEHGIEAVTAYVGNPLAHNFSLSRYIGILIGMSGIPMIYSPGTVDQWPKNVSSHLMYGGMWKIPVPDIQRTDLLVVMGANPHASQGSLLACPDVMGEIDAIQARGGKVIVIDPRRTGTADARRRVAADHARHRRRAPARGRRTWSCAEDLVDLGPVADLLDGVDELEALVADWTPERVAPVDRASTPSASARWPASSPTTERAVVYGRIGLCNQEFGTLASWLVDVVNMLTGHFDAVGGLMFPRPAVWSVTDLPMPGLEGGVPNFGRWKTPRARRARGARSRAGLVPRRGDRHAGRRSDPRAVHGRRQPGALDARRRPARRRARRARLHDQRRQLAERDDAPRRRDPARALAARAAAPRRPDLEVRGRQRARTTRRRSSRPPTAGPRSGRS